MRWAARWPVVLISFALFAAGIICWLWYVYPKGHRACSLPCIVQALRTYAFEHGGMFPSDSTDERQALQKLYPRYLADPQPLAGITGDRALLALELKRGTKLTEAASSWVYWSGLRLEDNPNIAIIWESKAGFGSNGVREPGHAVGFIAGNTRQVRDADWQAFLSEQNRLRAQAVNGRKAN